MQVAFRIHESLLSSVAIVFIAPDPFKWLLLLWTNVECSKEGVSQLGQKELECNYPSIIDHLI